MFGPERARYRSECVVLQDKRWKHLGRVGMNVAQVRNGLNSKWRVALGWKGLGRDLLHLGIDLWVWAVTECWVRSFSGGFLRY